MPAARILVIDGNVAATRARQAALVGYDSGGGYARVLRRLLPDCACDVICPADAPVQLPPGVGLEDYDGVTVTGSALNIYQRDVAVERQVEAAQAVFAAGVPLFGSCWGLQLAVTAAGGTVRANPRGREFGFARRIRLTAAGRGHALYAGKPDVFEAPTIHKDDVATLPAGATVLAANEMGVQAAIFAHGRGTFWGVQYHPEYDHLDIAAAALRYGAVLVDEGLFADLAALQSFAAELRVLHARPADPPLVWKHGLGPAMTDESLRLLELRNWLEQQVLPRAVRHA